MHSIKPSNYYASDMGINQTRDNYMEQFIMHSKAMAFGDTDIAVEVIFMQDPATQKKIGKKVAGFD